MPCFSRKAVVIAPESVGLSDAVADDTMHFSPAKPFQHLRLLRLAKTFRIGLRGSHPASFRRLPFMHER